MRNLLLSIVLSAIYSFSYSQSSSNFFTPADSFNKARFWSLTGGVVATYGGTLLLLNEYWYKNYDRSEFHFFDDSKEWLQMDKAGHLFNSYFISNWGVQTYKWTGLNNKNAAIAGSVAGSFLLTTIEILDGYSPKWGASWTDLAANTVGSGLVLAQQLAWQEQRILLKISAHAVHYPDDLRARASELYGNTVAETILKDYNAITLWSSFNIHSFIPGENKFPPWLNIAFGYGAEGLYGGFENKWCSNGHLSLDDCNPDELINRTDILRYRQLYFAPDIDLTRIKTNSRFLKITFFLLNIIKVPAPTLEYNGSEGVKFHIIYF